jgi:EmrB/QacA subfamily drug resistance transporter
MSSPATARRLVTIGLMAGTFLAALDAAVVGTAMPTVIASLGGTDLYTWVFAAYMLAFTTVTPLYGKLSDLFGQRRLYAAAVVLFLVGSGLCGAAQSMTQLIVFRAIQGVGGGGLMAMGMTIVGHVFTPLERPRMQGLMSAMWAVASLAGPAVGGLFTDHLSWRWVFFLNLPLGVIPAGLILTHLADTRREDAHPHIDFAGALSLALAVLGLLFALLWGPSLGWTQPRVLALLAGAALLLAVFVRLETTVPEPIVPFALFRIRTFSVCSLENFLTGAALFGILGFIPLFVQGVLGTSATLAGAAMMPMSIGWPIGSILAGRLVTRLGYRSLASGGLTLMVLGFARLATLSPATTAATVGEAMLVIGLGMGVMSPTVTAGVQNAVPRSHMGVASASIAFYRNIGGSLGVSALGAVMHSRLAALAAAPVAAAGLGVPAVLRADPGDPQVLLRHDLLASLPAGLVTGLRQALSDALTGVFGVSLVVAILGLVVALLYMPDGDLLVRPRTPRAPKAAS